MTDTDTDTDRIEHDIAGHRYLLLRGDRRLGLADYELAPGVITIVHTEIDPELQEHGLGSKLVAGVLDDIRTSSELRVAATCPFARRFLRDHPEYADLTTR